MGVSRCCCPARPVVVTPGCDPCAWDFIGELLNYLPGQDSGFFKRCVTQGLASCPVREFRPTTVSIEADIYLDSPGTVTVGIRESGVQVNASERDTSVGCPKRDESTFFRAVIGEASASEAAEAGVSTNDIIMRYQRRNNDLVGSSRFTAHSLAPAGGYTDWGEVKLTFTLSTGTTYDVVASYRGTTIVSETITARWFDPFWHDAPMVGPETGDTIRQWHTSIVPCVACDNTPSPLFTGVSEYWYPDAGGNAVAQVSSANNMTSVGVTTAAGGIQPSGLQFDFGAGDYLRLVFDLVDYGDDFTVSYWHQPTGASASDNVLRYGTITDDADPFDAQDDYFIFQASNGVADGLTGKLLVESLCGGDYTLTPSIHPQQGTPQKNLYVWTWRVATQDWKVTVGDQDTGLLASDVVNTTPKHDYWVKRPSTFSGAPGPVQYVNHLVIGDSSAIGNVDQPAVFRRALSVADLQYLWNGGSGNYDLTPLL